MGNGHQHIGIIGGGFSGIMALVNLVEKTRAPLRITLLEKTGRFAQGAAYGTWDANHLLNVPAIKMGAFAEDEAHFWHWLNDPAHTARWRPLYQKLTLDAEAFMPRRLYRIYLESLLEAALAKAKGRAVEVKLLEGEATGAALAGEQLHITYRRPASRAPETLIVDSLALATGNPPPRRFKVEGDAGDRFAADVWNPPPGNILSLPSLGDLPPETSVLIIGTGLTMIDITLTLAARGFRGKITALSRHGKLPCPHAPAGNYQGPDWLAMFDALPQRASQLFGMIRREVRLAEAQGHAWQDVIGSLRPGTNPLWQRLSLSEQRRLLRKAMPWWNILRHRMPLSSARTLAAMERSGQLEIRAGHLHTIRADGPLTVTWRTPGGETAQGAFDHLLNCTGPEMDPARSSNPLLLSLLAQNLILPGQLGTGLELAPDGSAQGSQGRIHPIGPLRLGADIESIAVPELRAQAAEVAEKLDFSREFHNY